MDSLFEKIVKMFNQQGGQSKTESPPQAISKRSGTRVSMRRQGTSPARGRRIKAGAKEYWKENWTVDGDTLIGSYRVGNRCFPGRIQLKPRLKFFILLREPFKKQVLDGPHGACFFPRESGKHGGTWYAVHWNRWNGSTPDAGIVAVEKTVGESIR